MTETGVLDLSLGGVGIAFQQPAAIGARVQLTLWLDDLADIPQPCYLPGEVIHRATGHLGIAFLDIGSDTMRAFRAVLGPVRSAPGTAAAVRPAV